VRTTVLALLAVASVSSIRAQCTPDRTVTLNCEIAGPRAGARMGDRNGLASGDLNGDGLADLVVASRGEVRAWLGHVPSGGIDLTAEDADILVIGAGIGSSVACGDVSGDGIDDLVIGGADSVHVVFGPLCPSLVRDLAVAPADVVLLGANLGWTEIVVDGSLVAGAPNSDYAVVLPPAIASGAVLSATDGLLVRGVHPGDALGYAIASGDLDGDGVADLAVGAPGVRASWGEVDVLLGPIPTAGVHDLATQPADIRHEGGEVGDQLGISLAIAELSGDCANDLVIGGMPRAFDGEVVAFFGPLAPGVTDLAIAPPDWRLVGRDREELGFALDAGDFNADGQDELLIGAPGHRWGSGPVREGAVLELNGLLAPGFDDEWNATGLPRLGLGGPADGRWGSCVLAADLLQDGPDDLFGGAPLAEGTRAPTDAGWVSSYPGMRASGGDPSACAPRTHGWWHRQCLGLDPPEGLDPGRYGRGRGPQWPQIGEDQLRAILARVARETCGFGASPCDALAPIPAGDACLRARRAVVAFLLNEAAGYLGPDAALEPPGEPPMTGSEARRALLTMLAQGDCLGAEQLALTINSGAACRGARMHAGHSAHPTPPPALPPRN
jgi:hypothetical protein